MRWTGEVIFILSVIGAAAAGASSCGARTSLDEGPQRTADAGPPDASQGGGGGAGGTGAGGTGHPVISESASSFIQSETSVAKAPNGFVAVAWIDIAATGDSTIGYTISTDDGASFPPPSFAASPGGRSASDPVIAVDAAGNFYLTWVGYFVDAQGSPSDMHVYAAKAAAGATDFGPAIEVSGPATSAQIHDKPWIAITNDGVVVVTYALATGAQSKLVASRSKDGVTWQQSVILQGTSAFWNLAFPCTPQSGKRIWVTYLAFTPAIDVGLTWSDDGGASWTPLLQNTKVNLPGEEVSFDDPNCVAQENEVWVSYGLTNDPPGEEESAKSFAIRLAHSSDGGVTIDARIDAHDPTAAAFFLHPQMAREDDGAIDLAYYAGAGDEDTNGTYRRSRAAQPLSGFSPSEVVEAPVSFVQARTDPRWLGDYTGLFWRGGALYTSYAVNATGASHIAFAKVKTP